MNEQQQRIKIMNRIVLYSAISFLLSAASFAEDTVKVLVGTQTFQCEINGNLSCKAINNVQQKEMSIKKDGAKIQIADQAKGLSADIITSLNAGNVVYDITLCSNTACSISDNNGGSNGYINQTMFGQYNITEKTFYVLGFFINSENKSVDLAEKIYSKFTALKK